MTDVLLELDPGKINREPQEITYELGNPELPIHAHRQEIVEAIDNNSLVILAGRTGSGKTTQVPQFAWEMKNELGERLFDDIIVTQPRRVAARTICERVIDEVSASDSPPSAGYYTSKEQTKQPQYLQDIALLTDGKAAAQLLHGNMNDDSDKKRLLIIDEVHEWNLNIEQLVAIAREKTNPESKLYDKNLKVVIMSATMDCEALQEYFEHLDPPLVEVSVPPQDLTETTRNEAAALVALDQAIETEEKVLLFLPSIKAIAEAAELIYEEQAKRKTGGPAIPVIPLHGKQTKEEQDRAFITYPNGSIIATTNVAETSLTVPDATTVVDGGEAYVDRVTTGLVPNGSDGIFLENASQANLKQRAGRVGRITPGVSILARPNDRTPLTPSKERPEFATPAMQRSRLDGLLLQLAATEYSVDDFTFFHKPAEEALQAANNRLVGLGALDDQGSVTDRGKKMDRLPLDPELACMVAFAQEKGYSKSVIRNVVDIVSIMQTGGILKKRRTSLKWRRLLEKDIDGEVEEKDSDFLAQLEAYVELASINTDEWGKYDVHEHSVEQVDENRESLFERLELNMTPATRVSQEDRQAVLNCINAGRLNQIWQRHGEEWTLATDNSEHYSLAESSTVSRLGELATGSLFSLGVRGGKVYNSIQNVTITSPKELEAVAAHLWVESELLDSQRFSEEKQEFVTTIERKLGNLVIGSYERVVEVEHGTDEATLYSSMRNSLLFKTWRAENPKDRQFTKRELQSMIVDPEPRQYGVDPITQEPLLAWDGANGWVASVEIARDSLQAALKRLDKSPIIGERKAQKAAAKKIRSELIPFKGDNSEVRDFIKSKKSSEDLGEWIEEGKELLSKYNS